MRLESVAGVRAMRSRSCFAAVSYCPRLKCVCARKCSILHLGGRGLVAQNDADEGAARLGIALDAVEIRELLQLLLDLVDGLCLQLGRGRAWPADVDDHRLDRERGILVAAEIKV